MAAAAEWQWIGEGYDDSMSDGGNMNTTKTTSEDIFKWIPPPQRMKGSCGEVQRIKGILPQSHVFEQLITNSASSISLPHQLLVFATTKS